MIGYVHEQVLFVTITYGAPEVFSDDVQIAHCTDAPRRGRVVGFGRVGRARNKHRHGASHDEDRGSVRGRHHRKPDDIEGAAWVSDPTAPALMTTCW